MRGLDLDVEIRTLTKVHHLTTINLISQNLILIATIKPTKIVIKDLKRSGHGRRLHQRMASHQSKKIQIKLIIGTKDINYGVLQNIMSPIAPCLRVCKIMQIKKVTIKTLIQQMTTTMYHSLQKWKQFSQNEYLLHASPSFT